GGHRVALHHVRQLPGVFRAADATAVEGGRGRVDRVGDAGELSRRGDGRGRAEDLHADEAPGAGGFGGGGIPERAPPGGAGRGARRGALWAGRPGGRRHAERFRGGDDRVSTLL